VVLVAHTIGIPNYGNLVLHAALATQKDLPLCNVLRAFQSPLAKVEALDQFGVQHTSETPQLELEKLALAEHVAGNVAEVGLVGLILVSITLTELPSPLTLLNHLAQQLTADGHSHLD
jgi:hypothetical protein